MGEAREILFRAKQRLLAEGWIQGIYSSSEGYCLVGATLFQKLDEEEFELALSLLAEQCGWPSFYFTPSIEERIQDRIVIIMRWNDRKGRTIDEVIAVLDGALLALDQQAISGDVQNVKEEIFATHGVTDE